MKATFRVFLLWGGNYNNDLNAGAYVNLNNTFSNSNSNNGASLSYLPTLIGKNTTSVYNNASI